jgi:ribosomal protein L24E
MGKMFVKKDSICRGIGLTSVSSYVKVYFLSSSKPVY